MRSRKATIGMIIVGLALLLLVGCTGGGGTSKYAVSGTVTGVDDKGIKGVALSFEGFGTAETDEDGKWRKDGLSGNVKVSPAKDGWVFEPSSRTVSKADSSVNFVATKLEYTLNIAVQGGGTVNQEVVVVAQGTEYEHGTQVQLTAVPATGWRFSHWEGDLDSNENPATVVVDSEKSVTAVFVILEYALNLTVQGEGIVNQEVVVAAQGTEYEHGTQVQLTAVPATGWRFSHWEGDLEGTENPSKIVVKSEKFVTAVFVNIEYVLALNLNGVGTVSITPNKSVYHYGDEVTLEASPDQSWAFSGWGGAISGVDSAVSIVMDSDKNIIATFAELFELSLEVVGQGFVSTSNDQSEYPDGSVVDVTATAADGWYFDRWEGDFTGSENPGNIVMEKNKCVMAVFLQKEYALSVFEDGDGTVFIQPVQETYTRGSTVELFAEPAEGWRFERWAGDLSGKSNPASITIEDNMGITAVFVFAIQSAIDSANDGDTIVVPPGTYFENLNFKGKNITLTSVDPEDPEIVSTTIIDGGAKDAVIRVENGEAGAVITGFTITNGSGRSLDGVRYGGGIYVLDSDVTLSHNIITGNSSRYGGGVHVSSASSSTITYNVVINNSSPSSSIGGGLYFTGGSHTITGNTVTNNSANSGGGLAFNGGTHTITGNTVTNNSAYNKGGGLYSFGDGNHAITGNTVSNNSSTHYGGGLSLDYGTHTIEGNTVIRNSARLHGGGLYLNGGGHTITGNTVTNNSAYSGGGIYLIRSRAWLTMNSFQLNNARDNGGAMWVSASSTVVDDGGNALQKPDSFNDYMDNTPENVFYE